MSGLFKKLNTLVRASLNDTFDVATNRDRSGDFSARGDKRLEKDAQRLRERINEAIDYEDGLQAKVDKLQAEIERLDREADVAVQQNKDATARHLIDQMQRTQQRLVMAESDLRQHQAVAEELIQQVNQMEAAIADNRYAKRQTGEVDVPVPPPAPPTQSAPKRVTIPVASEDKPDEVAADVPKSEAEPTPATDTSISTGVPVQTTDADKALENASETINAASDRIARMRETLMARQEANADSETAPDATAPDREAIETDLSNRRNRLSKPPADEK